MLFERYETKYRKRFLSICFSFPSKIRLDNPVQGDSGGLRLGWVDLDLGCSTILLGQ